MAAEELQVIGFWASPYSRRVELALKLKGLEYQYIEEDVLNYKSELLLKYNPIYKKIPVLLHHGQPIVESLVILEYIDENWKANYPILPQHPHQRAQARFWSNFIDHKAIPPVRKAAESEGEERERRVKEACKALEALEKELKSKRFFGGERIGLVDIVGIYVAYWIPIMEQALGFQILSTHRFPNLTKWSQQLTSHTLIKEVLPPRQDLFAYTLSRFKPTHAPKL